MSKGGRHRIFTEEQRKNRNRLAQAAFRARRSEYTNTLEETVISLETIVQELQDSNREANNRADAADAKCQMLKEQLRHLHQELNAALLENRQLLTLLESASTSCSSRIDPAEAISIWLDSPAEAHCT